MLVQTCEWMILDVDADVLPDFHEQQLPLLKHVLLKSTLWENSNRRAWKVLGYHRQKLEHWIWLLCHFFWVSQGGCLKIMLKFYPHILRGNVWRYPPCNYSQQFRGYGWLLLIVRNQFWNPLEASNLRVQKKHEHVSAGGRVRALRYESVWMSRVARCVTEWHKGVSVFPGWESEQNLKKRAYPPYIQTYHLKIDLWKRR